MTGTTMRGHRYPSFEARSVFRSPTWTQLAVAAVGLLVAFAALRAGAVPLAAVMVPVALAPLWPTADGLTLGTRIAEGWWYVARTVAGHTTATADLTTASWPRPVGRLRVAAHQLPGGATAGVVVDRGRRMVALRLAAPAAAALQTADQADRIAADFAGLVSALPADVVDRVQVLLVARDGGGDTLRRAAAAAAGPDQATDVVDDAADRIASRVRHVEAVVVVRLAGQAQQAAHRLDGQVGVRAAAVDAGRHVAESISGGATTVVGLLSADEWRGLLERQLNPAATDRSLTDPAGRLPPLAAVREDFKQVRTGATCHRSWWVAQWPQMPVGAGWWAPVLSSTEDLVVSMLVVPQDPLRAQSRMQLTLNRLSSSIATSKSRSITKERQLERVEQQMGDLADGHVPTRCVATVTTTAADVEQLDRAGLRLGQATTRARVRLAPLHGRQLAGWVWSLPLCRGLGG